jgi:hypothetical protein
MYGGGRDNYRNVTKIAIGADIYEINIVNGLKKEAINCYLRLFNRIATQSVDASPQIVIHYINHIGVEESENLTNDFSIQIKKVKIPLPKGGGAAAGKTWLEYEDEITQLVQAHDTIEKMFSELPNTPELVAMLEGSHTHLADLRREQAAVADAELNQGDIASQTTGELTTAELNQEDTVEPTALSAAAARARRLGLGGLDILATPLLWGIDKAILEDKIVHHEYVAILLISKNAAPDGNINEYLLLTVGGEAGARSETVRAEDGPHPFEVTALDNISMSLKCHDATEQITKECKRRTWKATNSIKRTFSLSGKKDEVKKTLGTTDVIIFLLNFIKTWQSGNTWPDGKATYVWDLSVHGYNYRPVSKALFTTIIGLGRDKTDIESKCTGYYYNCWHFANLLYRMLVSGLTMDQLIQQYHRDFYERKRLNNLEYCLFMVMLKKSGLYRDVSIRDAIVEPPPPRRAFAVPLPDFPPPPERPSLRSGSRARGGMGKYHNLSKSLKKKRKKKR